MALSVSPTESPQRVSLENLPIEILTTIIEQALPKDIPNQYDVVIESCTGCLEALKFITPHTVRRPRSQMEHRYAILYINKKIHAEALRILRARTFRIKIRHRNLFVWDLRSTRSASDCLHMGSGAQVPVFPGLDLGKIRKLAIEIAPADFQSIWYHARNALSALCERQLFPRGPIKRLYFLIEDMTRSKEDPLDPFFLFFPRITPAFEDYENVLQSCEQVVPAADHARYVCPTGWNGMKQRIALLKNGVSWALRSFSCLLLFYVSRANRKNSSGDWKNWRRLRKVFWFLRGPVLFESALNGTTCMLFLESKAMREGTTWSSLLGSIRTRY